MIQVEDAAIANEDAPVASHSAEQPIRIAIVATHAIQYYVPYYRALAMQPGVVVKVFFCRRWGAESHFDRDFGREVKWDVPMLDGYEWELLEIRGNPDARGFWAVGNVNAGQALQQFAPDVVEISGYAHRAMLQALFWCNRNAVPVIMASDSNLRAKRAWWKAALKNILVRQVYRRLDGVFSNGDNNLAYHVHYGAPPQRIFDRPLPIDCKALMSSAGNIPDARREVRRKHGIPDDAFVVTFAGKLAERKSPLHLLQAIHSCAQRGCQVWGIIVGDGVQRATLEQYKAEHKLTNVVLAGFVNQSVIAKYFAASDALALMSSCEAKGQVVPEAGTLGCPAILSDRVGCIGPNDCARPGENALVYQWGDIDAFSDCIIKLYHDEELRRSMSEAATRIARMQDASIAAAKMAEAARQLKRSTRQN